MTVNAHFTIGERFKGKRSGCRGLCLFAVVHHEHEAGSKGIPGDPWTDAEMDMHPTPSATFTSF
jgi:hypothetical protein